MEVRFWGVFLFLQNPVLHVLLLKWLLFLGLILGIPMHGFIELSLNISSRFILYYSVQQSLLNFSTP